MSKAENTRQHILEKAFRHIYKDGYQNTSINGILSSTSVTKGAFFYHFSNKQEMGMAVIKEIMYPGLRKAMIEPLVKEDDPIQSIYVMMKNLLLHNSFFDVKYGCPAVNLIDEMAPINNQFRKALGGLTDQWQNAIRENLSRAKANGNISEEANPEQIACFIVAGYSGIRSQGKIKGKRVYKSYLKQLQYYLNQL